jgi:Rieske Fe-S protein
MAKQKYIETPEILWQLFQDYKSHTKSMPIEVQDFVGKDGDEVHRKRERPLTIEGFESYCFEKGVINDLGDYFSNKNDKYSDFSTICRAIKREVRRDRGRHGRNL